MLLIHNVTNSKIFKKWKSLLSIFIKRGAQIKALSDSLELAARRTKKIRRVSIVWNSFWKQFSLAAISVTSALDDFV